MFKLIAVIILVFFNLFLIYYTVVLCYIRGPDFQSSFLVAYGFQILMDALLYETIQCFVVSYIIPSLIIDDFVFVSTILEEGLQKLSNIDIENNEANSFNAAEYFCLSHSLSLAFPNRIGND